MDTKDHIYLFISLYILSNSGAVSNLVISKRDINFSEAFGSAYFGWMKVVPDVSERKKLKLYHASINSYQKNIRINNI